MLPLGPVHATARTADPMALPAADAFAATPAA